jgi:hypothetical protein
MIAFASRVPAGEGFHMREDYSVVNPDFPDDFGCRRLLIGVG